MAKIEVNTIDTISGSTNLTIGSTNSSTVTFENGSCTGHMYPAFQINITSDQTLTSGTITKVQFNDELYDIGGYYDNSTNYRYTPLVAGKYFFYTNIGLNAQAASNLTQGNTFIYKNGSVFKRSHFNPTNGNAYFFTGVVNCVVEMNGTTDYIEFYASINDSSGSPKIQSAEYTVCGGYRIGS